MYLPHPPIAGCSPTQLDVYQPDGTPVVCTAVGENNLFYVPKHVLLNVSCVSCELARRINAVAEAKPGLARRDLLAKAMAIYEDRHLDADGRFPATFRILTLTAGRFESLAA